jgi:type I restriction-modification system DNA methylase subunit
MNHIENILNNLQLYRGDLHRGDWSVVFNEKRLADTIDPAFCLYAVFSFEKKPLILFFDNPSKSVEPTLHKWIWNLNESAVAVVVTRQTIDVFNAFDMDGERKLLRKIGDGHTLSEHFNYLKIVTGETWSEWRDKFAYANRVDSRLLRDLEHVRQITVQQLQLRGAKEQAYRIANAWIGRLLFIRYLIDRKVKIHFGEYADQWLSSDNLNQILENPHTTFALFEHLKAQFNGDLFPFIELSKAKDGEASIREQDVMDADMLQNFVKLFRGDDLNGQLSLFPLYDFSVIPIEFVSNVYEHFIGTDEVEKKKNKEKDKQREQGAYYTPKFLVDYILEKTVGLHLSNNPSTSVCRVLDPACGSGIFLVETLRRLILRYQSLHPGFEQNTEQYKDALRHLVWDNIFGIDIDNNAIDVAIFSLYVTLLDYQNSADIEHFKLPPLRNRNFFVGDTFDIELPFNKILTQKITESPFDFIIGNPPWGKTTGKQVYVEYCKKREKREKKSIHASNKEAAQAFLIRVSDFSTPSHTRAALIVTSKVLYNLQAANFRGYFLRHFFLDEILELSPVRYQVFDKTTSTGSKSKAIAPASVIFYQWADGADTSKNLVQHNALKPNIFFRLFKRFVFEKHDRKTVSQEQFILYDWLFKLLVYGNVLDFNLILRLKKDFKTIGQTIQENNIFSGQGLQISGGDNNPVPKHLIGRKFLDTKKKMLRKYFIDVSQATPWLLEEVHRPRNAKVYEPPYVLIKSGFGKDFSGIAAFSNEEFVFTHSITSFAGKPEDKLLLRNICANLNSKVFAYFNTILGSSAGVERDQLLDVEIYAAPFAESHRLAQLVEKLENYNKKIFEHSDLPSNNLLELKILEQESNKELENEIKNIFHFSEEEFALLQYSQDVSISIFKDDENSPAYRKIPSEDPILEEYAQVFLDYFKPRFTDHLGAEVYQSNYCVAVRVYRTEHEVSTPIVFKSNQTFQEIANLFFAQSFERLTEDLFIQKDVRGFDRKAFYIIKPNERKCWHKAVAYLDAYEFGETIERL